MSLQKKNRMSESWTCRGRIESSFYSHKLSFKHKRYFNETTFSSYMWHLSGLFREAYHHTQISQRNACCAYMKNCKSFSYLSQPEGTLEQET